MTRPRDELGWKVPRPGTQARLVYGLAKYGLKTRQIAETLNEDKLKIAVVLHRIKHPGVSGYNCHEYDG